MGTGTVPARWEALDDRLLARMPQRVVAFGAEKRLAVARLRAAGLDARRGVHT